MVLIYTLNERQTMKFIRIIIRSVCVLIFIIKFWYLPLFKLFCTQPIITRKVIARVVESKDQLITDY